MKAFLFLRFRGSRCLPLNALPLIRNIPHFQSAKEILFQNILRLGGRKGKFKASVKSALHHDWFDRVLFDNTSEVISTSESE